MQKLRSLEISHEKYPVLSNMGVIPSTDLTKISITTETFSVSAVEDLLEQVK